jgi:hypothetical protein
MTINFLKDDGCCILNKKNSRAVILFEKNDIFFIDDLPAALVFENFSPIWDSTILA